MRLLSLIYVTGAVASASRHACLQTVGGELVAASGCGDRHAIEQCLSKPREHHQLRKCFVEGGCSEHVAAVMARKAHQRCHAEANPGELKKRAVDNNADDVQNLARAAHVTQFQARATTINSGQKSGDNCFTTSMVSITTCPLVTQGDKTTSGKCVPTQVSRSDCLPGWTCSRDNQGEPICMDLKNGLDTGGIIIAIVFASALVLGVGTLTFLFCKDKREQKRLQAKAEATALARAATKKKRAAERKPLMTQQETPASGDPFSDQPRH